MTEPRQPPPPSEEEIAAAEEARVNALAVNDLHAAIYGDGLVRMIDDAYRAIVTMGRRAVAGDATAADVQAELDLVFGPGKVSAGDVLAPPDGPVVEPKPVSKK